MSLTKSVPVIAISGLAGSGKTTLGHACARAWAGIVVDLDDLALELTAQALAHHRDASQALAAIRDERYAEFYERIRQERVARSDSPHTGPVIAVAPFTKEIETAQAWSRFADQVGGGDVRLAWVRVDAQERLKRIRRRGAERDRSRADREEAGLRPGAPHIEVDGSLGTAQQVAYLRSRFDNGN